MTNKEVKNVDFPRSLLPGDKIIVGNVTSTILKIMSQDFFVDKLYYQFGEKGPNNSYVDIEFLDTNGAYRHYKSHLDGGHLEYAPENDELYKHSAVKKFFDSGYHYRVETKMRPDTKWVTANVDFSTEECNINRATFHIKLSDWDGLDGLFDEFVVANKLEKVVITDVSIVLTADTYEHLVALEADADKNAAKK